MERCPGCGFALPHFSNHCDMCGWSAPEGLTAPPDPLAWTPQVKPFLDATVDTGRQPPLLPSLRPVNGPYDGLHGPPEPLVEAARGPKPSETKDLSFILQAGGYSAKRNQVYRILKPRPPEQFSAAALEKEQIKRISAVRSYAAIFEQCRGGTSMKYGYHVTGDWSWLEPLHSVSSQEKHHPYWPIRARVQDHLLKRILGKRFYLRVLCDDGIVYDQLQIAYFIMVYNLWQPSCFKYTDEELATHMSNLFPFHPRKCTETRIRYYRRTFNLLNPSLPMFKYARYPWDAPRPIPSDKFIAPIHRVYVCKNSKWLVPIERIYPTRGSGVKYLMEKIPPTLRWGGERRSKPVPVKHIIREKELPKNLSNAIAMAEKEMSNAPRSQEPNGVVDRSKQRSTLPIKRTRLPTRKTDTPYCGFDTFPGWRGNS